MAAVQQLSTSDNVFMSLTTPLGKDVLILQYMESKERISSLFEYKFEVSSKSPDIDFDKILGKKVTATLDLFEKKRFFNGVVTEFKQLHTKKEPKKDGASITYYEAVVRPELYLLKLTRDCRIFQNMDAMSIIKKVLEENKVTDIKDDVNKRGKIVREYCVQYNESCFDFISRLMEEEGIFYYFTHTEKNHTLVLADNVQTHKPCENVSEIPMRLTEDSTLYLNMISDCEIHEQATPKEFIHTDYNYMTPDTNLLVKVQGDEKSLGGTVYTYPGRYGAMEDGEGFGNVRSEAQEFSMTKISGDSTAPYFLAGAEFTLKGHAREKANQKYTLYQVEHTAKIDNEDDGLIYKNRFIGFNSKTTFRPPTFTPKPRIEGVQTAVVTGKEEEEIWTDELGRVKVQFFWDQLGEKNEQTTCWVRVAQGWAGSGWGMLYTPRIGHEVVVTFVDGDPDRPLIIGSVYNNANKPPYLADEPTKSTILTQSSIDKNNPKGFNELRFEDKAGEEEVYMHAQKDMNIDIIEDFSRTIETGDYTTEVGEGDRKVTLKGDDDTLDRGPRGNDTLILNKGSRTVQLLAEGDTPGNDTLELTKGDKTVTLTEGNEIRTLTKGDQTITLTKGNQATTLADGDQTVTVTKGNRTVEVSAGDETHTNGGGYTQTVTKDYMLKVTGNLTLDVTGNITIKSGQAVNIQSGMDTVLKPGMNLTVNAAVGVTVVAGAAMTLKGGAPVLMQSSAPITLKGAVVMMA